MAWPLSLLEGVGACWEILTIFLFFPGLVLPQQLGPLAPQATLTTTPRGSPPFLISPFYKVFPSLSNLLLS